MYTILMLDQNDIFIDDIEQKALAGTQTAFIELAKTFSNNQNKVYIRTGTEKNYKSDTIDWDNMSNEDLPSEIDLLVVNVSPFLFTKFPKVKFKKKVLWIHNEAKYLIYWTRMKYIIRYFPIIVFSGNYHKSTYPFPLPCRKRVIIPFGLNESLLNNSFQRTQNGNPKIVFTSNPLRSLRWLIDVWVNHIHKKVPEAELHLFSGSGTYGKWGIKMSEQMKVELDYAYSHRSHNIFLHEPIPKNELFQFLKNSTAMFYRGDRAETFCLAVAEAQALGLPCVVCDLGSMRERVIHKETGFVANNETEFISFAIEILQNEQLRKSQSENAIAASKKYNWDASANQFISLLK